MHVESQITILRSRREIFDYLADGEHLPEYATDFTWVKRIEGAAPGQDTTYAYRMTRGAEGTFRHTVYEPYQTLAWQGPPARSGPGTIAPRGGWTLDDLDRGTRVTLIMSPIPGGALRLITPLITASIRKTLPDALLRLKQRLELSAVEDQPTR